MSHGERGRRLGGLAVALAVLAGFAACSDALDANTAIGLQVAVANTAGGSVSLVDIQTFITEEVPLAPGATPTTMAARDTLLLVALGGADAVEVLPPGGASLVVPLAPGSGATGLAIEDDSIAWVGALGLNRAVQVNYLRGDTIYSFSVGPAPRAVLLPGNNRLYVVNSNTPGVTPAGPSSISWIELGGASLIGTIALTGANARYAAVGADGLIYVVMSGTPGAADGRLSIVDPGTHLEVAVINGLGESPGPAVYHPSGRLLIASLAEGILEVNTTTRSLVRGRGQGIKPGGAGVAGLVIDPRGRVYATAPGACIDPGQLYLLQAPPDYRVIETVPVGVCPSAAAILEMPRID